MDTTAAIQVDQLSYRYGERLALDDLSLRIESGEIFVVLGPNGGGKSTLFRVLSTLVPIQQGSVQILGVPIDQRPLQVRQQIGVVFQSPSLDKKLSVQENLRHQAALYGLTGRELYRREDELLEQLGLTDRRRDRVETLSGGLRRRVELAKGLIHRPRVILMDEPSTGLDPAARSDLWRYLQRLRETLQVTIALTTHLLEEAERGDRIAILHQGRRVAFDTPAALRESIGGDTITIETSAPEELARQIAQRWNCPVEVVDQTVRLEQPAGHQWVGRLMDALGDQIRSIKLGKPTLEDVFIAKTGHRFWQDSTETPPPAAEPLDRLAEPAAMQGKESDRVR